jgi:hypothetical protein
MEQSILGIGELFRYEKGKTRPASLIILGRAAYIAVPPFSLDQKY